MANKKLPNLDALRAFLAISVVICHIPRLSEPLGIPFYDDLPIIKRGFDAVLVFFSLSGFLIIGMLYDEKLKYGSINIKNFYIRRILRLYPVYYLVLIFGLIFYIYIIPLIGMPQRAEYSLWEGIAWNAGFLPNVFRIVYDPGFILLILWSIGIEEQFYLFIAPFIYLMPKKWFFKSLIFFTVIYFILFHIEVFINLEKYLFYYFNISIGGIIAIIFRHQEKFKFLFQPFLKYATYILSILYFFTDWFIFDSKVLSNLFVTITFSLLILYLANEKKIIVTNKNINYMGKISYGIYMYHIIVLHLVLFPIQKFKISDTIGDAPTIILINISCLIITILMSHFSFKYYERFFLKFKNKYRRVIDS
ncbi:acyltransferase [Algibacter sp. 2305UL17-15]|uniref:acyltransferase family protein n=1 Tax=Algibacter sp. 2305UL17-15 TaxID=3231268 RepID=UPI003459FD1E